MQDKKTILFASDHAGFELKNILLKYTEEFGYKTEDMGPYEYKEADDYPDFIMPLAEKISKANGEYLGVILGGSGQGEAMAANRYRGVRATVYYSANEEIIKLSKEHNDANVLSFGARFVSEEDAKSAISLWLKTDFSKEDRHIRRIEKLDNS